ncbi:unnamed protein product [Schistocephalus solidus]|uniref:WD repeat-containing protein WRAP73 n=1 Tax=Schistocephalus solidus TaxID=70667 RepID=A0A183SC73_SCHSO|nr:unnamed protein product [Schistocephalus solidus]
MPVVESKKRLRRQYHDDDEEEEEEKGRPTAQGLVGILQIVTGLSSSSAGPYLITPISPPISQLILEIGVGLCLFSPTGRYLVTRVDNAPGTLWVWRAGLRFSLISILTHTSGPVLSAAWDPQSTARLALCIGTDVVFMWTPQGCVAVEVSLSHFYPPPYYY